MSEKTSKQQRRIAYLKAKHKEIGSILPISETEIPAPFNKFEFRGDKRIVDGVELTQHPTSEFPTSDSERLCHLRIKFATIDNEFLILVDGIQFYQSRIAVYPKFKDDTERIIEAFLDADLALTVTDNSLEIWLYTIDHFTIQQ